MNIAIVLLSNLEALVRFSRCSSYLVSLQQKKNIFPGPESTWESLTAFSCPIALISFSSE